ncbi:MAG: YbaB/EbfC family nucleoid-associated protein [Bacteroidia bacterium]|nr:YbaB/EbfC family nucleoid-associated protein [Bacteroidia bacterium]
MNLADMFGKLNEMKQNMENVRASLDQIHVEAESGGGMVKVVANANKQVLKLSIDPSVATDREMMEDLIVAAINKALEKAEEKGREELSKAASGMLPNLPGLDLSQLGLK